MPIGPNWQSITFGNGKFLAVGRPSNIAAYSTDGTNWIAVSLPKEDNWYGIAYGNNLFVATVNGSYTAAYSAPFKPSDSALLALYNRIVVLENAIA